MTTVQQNGVSWAMARLHDYAELIKLRVTTLVVITAWCGFYLGCRRADLPTLSWNLFHALLGIGLVSGGTAALNEALERDVDRLMARTADRPLPAGRMTLFHAATVGTCMTLGGSLYLLVTLNRLTAGLAFATSLVYLAAYTPLKRVSPICTLVGAIPGAMPGVLGWTAARGQLEWGAFALFTILFVWQFPHFFSIAWLYRDDYARGGIRMLPVVEPDGRSTALRILLYSMVLIPVSLLPGLLGMAGHFYLAGAPLLSTVVLCFGVRLAVLRMPIESPYSKQAARRLLRVTVLYLPALLALMMSNSTRP